MVLDVGWFVRLADSEEPDRLGSDRSVRFRVRASKKRIAPPSDEADGVVDQAGCAGHCEAPTEAVDVDLSAVVTDVPVEIQIDVPDENQSIVEFRDGSVPQPIPWFVWRSDVLVEGERRSGCFDLETGKEVSAGDLAIALEQGLVAEVELLEDYFSHLSRMEVLARLGPEKKIEYERYLEICRKARFLVDFDRGEIVEKVGSVSAEMLPQEGNSVVADGYVLAREFEERIRSGLRPSAEEWFDFFRGIFGEYRLICEFPGKPVSFLNRSH